MIATALTLGLRVVVTVIGLLSVAGGGWVIWDRWAHGVLLRYTIPTVLAGLVIIGLGIWGVWNLWMGGIDECSTGKGWRDNRRD